MLSQNIEDKNIHGAKQRKYDIRKLQDTEIMRI